MPDAADHHSDHGADHHALDGVTRLIVDGNNVLYALRRSPQPLPAATLIGRLRAIVPPGVAIVVVLDGSPEHGLVSRRVASGVEVRYAGRVTADEHIARLVEQTYPDHAETTLVVTDDFDLSTQVRRWGGRTVGNRWLIDRLGRQRLSAPAPGRPSPPTPSAGSAADLQRDPDSDAAEPRRWSPGRNATRKRGNPRRRPASGR
jgi:hypothetical protein